MALENLDLVDRKILSYLDRNAHISYSELGKKARVAKETVKYRIKTLQKRGIIKGFYTAVNFAKMGYHLYRIYLRLQNTSPPIEKEISEYLSSSKEVFLYYVTNGPYNVVLGVWAKNMWDYEAFWLEFRRRYGKYFSSVSFSILTKYTEFSREYLLPTKMKGKKVFTTVERSQSEKLDETDFRILAIISHDARASLTAIANDLGISVVTARHRLKNLINRKVIVGFRPVLDLRKLGREYYKVDLWFRKFDRIEEITQSIISHPEVVYTETTTSSDLEFDIETKDFRSFMSIMNSFKEKFPEDIRDYSYYSLVKGYKLNYAPPF